jgi:transposase
LSQLSYITRIPGTLNREQAIIQEALEQSDWHEKDEKLSYQSFSLTHYEIDQRWIVCYSQPARHRAEQSVEKACKKEKETVNKQLFHLQAQRFESQKTAEKKLSTIEKKLKYHRISEVTLTGHKKYASRGRPTPETPVKSIEWQIDADVESDPENIEGEKEKRACFVIGTNTDEAEVSDEDAIDAYKGQDHVEKGFRFLKDPLFFVSSLFIKTPSRIQALLMVMTLALLVYSIAQRRLRNALAAQNETIPNQIKQPTATPTLRWIFQLMEGINLVVVSILLPFLIPSM